MISLTGTVVNVTFDNLGGNISLGFSSCSSKFFCRICEITRKKSKTTSQDDLNIYRTKDTYAVALDIIETSVNVDFKKTKGIAEYCVLNDLKYFHILDNYCADIMHDICEGVLPFLLKCIFDHCIQTSIFKNEAELRNFALFHDYGVLNSKNIPSAICYKRRNLGQNASQQKCLMHHVPYILYKYKYDPRLIYVWPAVHSMLEILRIVYDANINECDLLKLESAVSVHLKSIIEYFDGSKLLPKHHYMLHYANIIRAAGPVVHMSTMRFEMQHKQFTKYAHRSNNFLNVSKSLATNFQKSILSKTAYQCEVNHAKLRELGSEYRQQYGTVLSMLSENIDQISTTKWLQINSNQYRKGLLLKNNNNKFCEIDEILCVNGGFSFSCYEYELAEFDWFLYSIEIKKLNPLSHLILNHTNLHVKKSFTKKNVDSKFYIIADCLDVPIE